MKQVYGLDSSSNGICQYPCVQSNTAKHFNPVGIRETISLDAGKRCVGLSTYLFNWTRSTTEQTLSFGLRTNDIGEHHGDTPGRGASEEVSAVGFCLGSGFFGSSNSD